MKKMFLGLLGVIMMSSLWAENRGHITLFGGYNAWVLGQLFTSEANITEGRVDGGGFSFGGEALLGNLEKTQFGLEVAWQPLLTASGKDPSTGQTKTLSYVQTPILGKVVFGGSGFYGDLGLGISFITVYGNKELQEIMNVLMPDPALTGKFGVGYRKPLNDLIGLDIAVNTTIVFGDYGMFRSLSTKPPVWLNMILFWQVGFRAGLSVYF